MKGIGRYAGISVLSWLLVGGLLTDSAALAAPTKYTIDASHTTVGFKVRHLGISTVPGSFTEVDGTITYDSENVAASATSVKISAKSVSTANQKRDDHLRNADFFDVAKFPEIAFVSTKVEPSTTNEFLIHGDLTIHGVTKPVVLSATFDGEATDPWGNKRAAFSATTTIKRSDFGLTWNKALETGGLVVGDEVKVEIAVEGIKA